LESLKDGGGDVVLVEIAHRRFLNAVIARSEATKQSRKRSGSWIASLRSQ
jgi:hypothetical protein